MLVGRAGTIADSAPLEDACGGELVCVDTMCGENALWSVSTGVRTNAGERGQTAQRPHYAPPSGCTKAIVHCLPGDWEPVACVVLVVVSDVRRRNVEKPTGLRRYVMATRVRRDTCAGHSACGKACVLEGGV